MTRWAGSVSGAYESKAANYLKMEIVMRFFAAALTLFLSVNVLADGVILRPMQGYKELDVVKTENITGSCGGSVVRVMGITDFVENFYSVDSDAGKIIVRSSSVTNDLVLTQENVLSDHNGVACVETKTGDKLLVWSNCGGSRCTDNFSFYVIEPKSLKFIAPKDPKKGSCDDECATKVLGNNLPKKVNGWQE